MHAKNQLASMFNAPPGKLNLSALRVSRPALANLYALVGTDPVTYLRQEPHWREWTPEIIEWVAAVGMAAADRLVVEGARALRSPVIRGGTAGPPPRPPWPTWPTTAHRA